ncbi:MAG: hypothetical protein M4579_004548 [Chaenotheca gracillima]|nr:MAG: hypothetical protein M4579_004548 [Chaenotheca gracillima]
MGSFNPSSKPSRAIVVGAGLGGCAAALALHAHHPDMQITVLEKVRQFNRLGDSLGLGFNAFRLLKRWGCDTDQLKDIGNQSPTMCIRRWGDGMVLAEQELMDMAGYIGHRGDYHEIFLNWVREKGIPIRMNSQVLSYDAAAPSVSLKSGETLHADIIIASDGIKSLARSLVTGYEDHPRSSGYACFRAYADTSEELKTNPMTSSLFAQDSVNIWIGPDVHLVQNSLRGGTEFNWILTRKDPSPFVSEEDSWFHPGDMDEVRRIVNGGAPREPASNGDGPKSISIAPGKLDEPIRMAVSTTKQCLDWKICYRDPLPRWGEQKHGKIILLGDSCHAHLPTSAQGASQAVESAGVLSVCLELCDGDVGLATRVYEKLRFARTRQSQMNGEDVRDRWHNALKNVDMGKSIDPDDVKIRNRWLYAFDAEADAGERWETVKQEVEQELREGGIRPLC